MIGRGDTAGGVDCSLLVEGGIAGTCELCAELAVGIEEDEAGLFG